MDKIYIKRVKNSSKNLSASFFRVFESTFKDSAKQAERYNSYFNNSLASS